MKAWSEAVTAANMRDKLSEEAMAAAEALSYAISNRGAGELELEPPENFQLALQIMREVRAENAKLALLRRREIELLKRTEPVKAADLVKHPDKPAGDVELKAQMTPEMAKMRDWDWRVDLLDERQRHDVFRVWSKVEPWKVCSRCRYSSGCPSCDAYKTLRYWLVKQGYITEGMWM